MSQTRWIGALVCVLALAACSGSPIADEGNRSRLGDSAVDGSAGKGSKKLLKKAAKVGAKAEQKADDGSVRGGTSAKAAGEPPGGSTTTSAINPAFARRSASVDDPRDDATKEGITPAYAEIVKASITGLGEDFRLTLILDGQVPDAMPNDKTHMIIAFGITGAEEDEGYSFGAQATEEGWSAYAGGRDDGNSDFPGTFFIKNNTIEMVVPWDYINGPRAFEWYSASNWFSQLANQTHYRVDLAPSNGLTKFPQ